LAHCHAVGVARGVALAAACGLVASCAPEEPIVVSTEIAALQSEVDADVDVFDDGDVGDWKVFVGPSSTLTHRLSSSRATTGGTSMKLTYDVAPGSYAGVERALPTGTNWSARAGLGVALYGNGLGHGLLVQIYDAGGERWETVIPIDFSGWRRVTLPFSAFARARWQSSSAAVNGIFDLGSVRGLALVPGKGGGVAGSLYVDSLAAVDAADVGDGTAPPTPDTTADRTAGTIVPLYSTPSKPAWTTVVAAKTAHPGVPVLAVVNPSNGPGLTRSASYTAGIARLVAAGVKVIGYVFTDYARRPAAEVEADVRSWRQLYPAVTGVFFDEQANRAGSEDYYRRLVASARAQGFDFTIGNPGTDTTPGYVGICDVTLIYESEGLPTLDELGGWHAGYDRKRFGIIPHAVATLDTAFVDAARQRVGYSYLQSDTLPNPWDTVPDYFPALVAALDR
jgi:hypothetical protein